MNKTQKQILRTVCGLGAGIVCGWLMHQFLDKPTQEMINGEVLVPLRDVFLNALKMMMAPVTFFAILAGITNIQDEGILARMGRKLMTVSLFM